MCCMYNHNYVKKNNTNVAIRGSSVQNIHSYTIY